MLTSDQIIKVASMREQFGESPFDGFCDRNWSPARWGEYQERLGYRDELSAEPTPKVRVVSGKFHEFYHPQTQRKVLVPVVYDNELGRERPHRIPMTRDGQRYEDRPF